MAKIKLNKHQVQAIKHTTGPCLVVAVPGSGKTRCLTSRVARLIKHGEDPRGVLCLTFTNKAAREMMERTERRLSKQQVRGLLVCTFHKLCVLVLSKYGKSIGLSSNFTIYDKKDQQNAIKRIARKNGIEINDPGASVIVREVDYVREEMLPFKELHNRLDTPDFATVGMTYLDSLLKLGCVDFSGLLYFAWQLLQTNSRVRKALQEKFCFICVDESQDTNRIQYDLVCSLGEQHKNVYMIGDPDQSIYGWRGARPDNLDKFQIHFPDCRVITLPVNYRSTADILAKSEVLIHNNSGRAGVKLISNRGVGAEVQYAEFEEGEGQARSIAGTIKQMLGAGKRPKDFAVLYRVNRSSRIIETTLRLADLPYRITGGFSFYDRKEVRMALSYLTLLANPKNGMAFAEAIAVPSRQVGPVKIGKVENFAEAHTDGDILAACLRADEIPGLGKNPVTNLRAFAQLLAKHQEAKYDLRTTMHSVFKKSGFYDYYEGQGEEDGVDRFANVEEFVISLDSYDSADAYLRDAKLTSPEDKDDPNVITLSTIHSAKGLEWPCVFLIDVEEGVLPSSRALAEGDGEEDDQEERRLMYVAMTRAKDWLHISSRATIPDGRKRDSVREVGPSRFLGEIGLVDIQERAHERKRARREERKFSTGWE